MIIRSQNKEVIINFENLISVRIGGYSSNSIVVFTECEALEIGKYSTTEKAIKVLDVIQEEYLYCERCRARGEEAGYIPSYVFQMPQDEEVK